MVRGLVLAMAAPAGTQQVSAWVQFIPFVLVLAIFYFIIILPMRRRQKKVQEFLDALKVGDRVVTTGGIYGSITKMNDKSVQIQIADKGYQGQEPVVADTTARES